MRLLYVIDGLGRSGSERSFASMAPGLVRAGVELDVGYFADRHTLARDLEAEGVGVFSLPGARESRFARVARLRELVRDRQPDLVHTTLYESDLAGRLAAASARVPTVSSLVNVMYGTAQLADARLSRWKVRAAQAADAVTARLAVRLHAVSGYVADVMAQRLHLGRTPVDVVPRGRDPALLGRRSAERRSSTRVRLGIGPDEMLVVATARHEFQKGLDVLVEAFGDVVRREPRARLVIAGREGSETVRLRSIGEAKHLGEKVQLLGGRDDVPDLLSACDVFVLPSRWEGAPGALLEAMALEAPIVASDLRPVRELVGNEQCARLVPPDRPDALAEAIVAIASDPDSASARTAVARSRFLERYTVERAVEGMLAFYERALGTST